MNKIRLREYKGYELWVEIGGTEADCLRILTPGGLQPEVQVDGAFLPEDVLAVWNLESRDEFDPRKLGPILESFEITGDSFRVKTNNPVVGRDLHILTTAATQSYAELRSA